jgi:hypothetical protein
MEDISELGMVDRDAVSILKKIFPEVERLTREKVFQDISIA